MSITATQDITRQILSAPALAGTQDLTRQILPFGQELTGSLYISRRLGIDATLIQLVLNGALPNLAGAITVEVQTEDGGIFAYGPSAQDIQEIPAGTGRYIATIPRPNIGRYLVVWRYGAQATQPIPFAVLNDSVVQTPIRLTTFSEYRIKAGDLEPSLLFTLRNAGGDEIDLSNALDVHGTVTRLDDDPIVVIDDRPLVLIDAEHGQAVLDWGEDDERLAGVHQLAANINWPTGRATAPSRATYRFVIEP